MEIDVRSDQMFLELTQRWRGRAPPSPLTTHQPPKFPMHDLITTTSIHHHGSRFEDISLHMLSAYASLHRYTGQIRTKKRRKPRQSSHSTTYIRAKSFRPTRTFISIWTQTNKLWNSAQCSPGSEIDNCKTVRWFRLSIPMSMREVQFGDWISVG